MFTIWNRIQEIRLERGLTVKQLAETVGTDADEIKRFEKGKCVLTVDWIYALSLALRVYPDDLFCMPACRIDRLECRSLLSFILGWLQTACRHNKMKPGTEAFSEWATSLYEEANHYRVDYGALRVNILNFVAYKKN